MALPRASNAVKTALRVYHLRYGCVVQWRIQRRQSGHGLPLKLAMEFGRLGGRKNNDSIVNLAKCEDFGPLYRCWRMATDLAPQPKNSTLKAIKCSMTKKALQKFWEIDEILLGNAEIFPETPKKGNYKNSARISPPVSEVLDPLVASLNERILVVDI